MSKQAWPGRKTQPAIPRCLIAGWVLGLSLVTVAAWYLIVHACLPRTLGDEMYHFPAIQALAQGRMPDRQLPMPLTYHFLISIPARWLARVNLPVGRLGAELWVIRAFQAGLAVAALLLYRAMLRRRYVAGDERRLLLLAWNPLLLPFFALVYTDLASLLAVLVGMYFHLRARPALAAAALLLACLIRQSNLMWVLFVVAWRASELWAGVGLVSGRSRWPGWSILVALLRRERVWLHGLVAAAVLLLLHRGGLVPAPFFENRPAFNVAQFHLFGLTMGLCWLPLWTMHLAANWRAVFAPLLLRPWGVAAFTAAVGLLAVSFSNRHPWNQELEFLHNWPLRLMAGSVAVRLIVSLGIVTFVLAQGQATWHNPARPLLVLVWVFSVLFLIPHYPADARYYIVPLVLLDFFTPYSPAAARRLCLWYLLLATGVGTFIALRPGPYGGL